MLSIPGLKDSPLLFNTYLISATAITGKYLANKKKQVKNKPNVPT
jgi:hypothetical protein